ncbi:hypothetical protein M3Y94_01214100 [Aphelenchoides besseyi]|nr:hypothetical protein M3Y94_01214100 [Aphelenchoides besseyi]KAI6228549.1 hypothetical protein M3Y95_00633800 [Aphelenchoides besseyi]
MVRYSQTTQKKRESLARAREVRRVRLQEAARQNERQQEQEALQNAVQESSPQVQSQEPQPPTSTVQPTSSRVEDRELSITQRERLLAEREHQMSQRETEFNQREREFLLQRADYDHKLVVLQTQSIANAEKFEQMTEDLKRLKARHRRLQRKLEKSNGTLPTDDENQANERDGSFDSCLWTYT